MSQTTHTAGLTEDQIDFHKTFGYTVLKQLFSTDELATIRKEFDATMAEQYAHRPYDGSERHWAPMTDEDTPFFASLMEDPRFLTVAKQLYGTMCSVSAQTPTAIPVTHAGTAIPAPFINTA